MGELNGRNGNGASAKRAVEKSGLAGRDGLIGWLLEETEAAGRRVQEVAVSVGERLRSLPELLPNRPDALRLPRPLVELLQVASRKEVAELRQRIALLEQQLRERPQSVRVRRAAPPS
jgi:hypothetical protein